MNQINYKAFLIESLKITAFCLMITGLFRLFGTSNKTLLVIFNMAVMSSAATFSVEKKHLSHVALGSCVMIFSIVTAGVIGYYNSRLGMLLTILYAGLAFYLPKTKIKTNIFVTGSVMFLIFTALPFSWEDGVQYALDGLVVIIAFVGFYWLIDSKRYANVKEIKDEPSQGNHITSVIAVLSLIFAGIISHYLQAYSSLSHLYWMGLTALVVIQGSQQKTIQTSIKRICVNAFGAIVIVLLFSYIMPPNFWINFIILVLFLFLIFFLSFSYVGRTLFIELFVLGFTHLLGDYHNVIALDRFILTLIGGTIVIMATIISHFIFKQFKLSY